MPRDHLMRAALALAGRGMAVFPLRPGTKRPAVNRDWENCATTDTEQIERWWVRAPYNVGVATGPSRLVVVDLDVPSDVEDGPSGYRSLAALAGRSGAEVPQATFTVVTPSGGSHLYFRAPDGRGLTNTAGRLGPLIDTRAVGGYVVGPGSRFAGRRYQVVNPAPPAGLPTWLADALRPRLPAPAVRRAAVSEAYVDAALRNESLRVAEAATGQRNSILFQAAARLGRFVADGRLADRDVREALRCASIRHVGVERFTAYEVERTIDSGLRRARTGPRVGRASPGRSPAP